MYQPLYILSSNIGASAIGLCTWISRRDNQLATQGGIRYCPGQGVFTPATTYKDNFHACLFFAFLKIARGFFWLNLT